MAPPKAKGQKMGLGEFLTDASLGSWADEMEDAPMPSRPGGYGNDRNFSSGGAGGMSSYMSQGYSMRETLPLPSKPPFTVHLGNMSFDATEGDVQDFFADCSVTSVRIVEDKIDRKPKGFGYAEFATLEGLKKALDLTGSTFQGRNIRISVAEPQKDRIEAREISDWTRKGPLPDTEPRRTFDRPGFNSGKGMDQVGEPGTDRQNRRPPFEAGDGRNRDFSNWERKGPLNPVSSPNAPPPRPFDRPSSREGPKDRRDSPASWGEGRSGEARSNDGSRPPRRDFSERPVPERAPTAADLDNQWRSKMRPDAPPPPPQPPAASPTTSDQAPTSPTQATHATLPSRPTTRPKLNLQKRTVSSAENLAEPQAAGDSKSSPFGAARPIDTAAREKEIEEKIRQRKVEEEKAREEKRAADEKAKEERRQAKEAEKAEKAAEKAKDKPNGTHERETSPRPGKNYQILRRDAGDDAASSVGASDEASAATNGDVPAPASAAATSTTGSTATPSTEATPTSHTTTEAADDEGWSTVSKPQRKSKGASYNAKAVQS